MYKKVLELSEETLKDDQIEKSEELFESIKNTSFKQIESFITTFSVASHEALTKIFFLKSTPATEKAEEFVRIVEIITFDPEWPKIVAKIAHNVFNSRMRYHTQKAQITSEVSYSSLIIGLLKNSIQTISFIFSPLEKLSPNESIIEIFGKMMYDSTIDLLAENMTHSAFALRSLFSETKSFDEWLSTVDFLRLPPLSETAFVTFGIELKSILKWKLIKMKVNY